MRTFTEEQLLEIIESHGRWLMGEEGVVRANLEDADLRNADLKYANLKYANLKHANLRNADLRNANLKHVCLRNADLRNADLEGACLRNADLRNAGLEDADLEGACLEGACLEGACLDKKYYQVVRIGSRKGTTTYNATDGVVLCGSWNDYKGGTLDEFTARVESVYGEEGISPNKQYYAEYMAAIEFFKKMREV